MTKKDENKFVVDLGAIDLTDDQRKSINAAIQKAVTGELANINVSRQIAIIPRSPHFPGPILQGIVAGPLEDQQFIKSALNTK